LISISATGDLSHMVAYSSNLNFSFSVAIQTPILLRVLRMVYLRHPGTAQWLSEFLPPHI
jgi:hypothetical protein